MIWIAYVAGALVAVLVLAVAVMAAVGAALPAAHVAARTARFASPCDDVWRVMLDRATHAAWRRGVKRVEDLPDRGGRATFREHTRDGVIFYVADEAIPPAGPRAGRLVTRIADDTLPYGGRWIYDLVADGSGCRLTITEDGFVKNVLFRFLSRFVFGHTASLEAYLRDLGTRLGETVEPTEAAVAH